MINASPLRYEIRLGDKGWSSVITQATPWKDRERGEENSKGEEKEQATKPARDHARGAREESINDPPQTPPSPPTNDKDSSTDSPTKWGHFALERNNANHHLPAAANHSYPPPETPPKNDPAAEVENSLPPPSPAREEINNRPHTSPPPQAFELTVSPSQLNHQSYIERQGYFGPFSVDKKHVMADDLEKRVPLEGLIDCQLLKQQAPLRMRLKREKEPLRLSLTALRRPD